MSKNLLKNGGVEANLDGVELAVARGRPRIQYERSYILAHPSADRSFMLDFMEMAWSIGERWTIGGSADDAGIGNLGMRRVIALRPDEWPRSNEAANLEEFFEKFYPGIVYWPLDWDNDYQLKGRLLAYSLREAGFKLAYPTTRQIPSIVDAFGRWRPESEAHHCGLDLASSWPIGGDEVLSATDGMVVEAGWHDNQDGFGYRVRVKAIAPDGREVLIRYAHLTGYDGIYVGVGDKVMAGRKLGRPDSSGKSTKDHLHIDLKIGDTYADPALLIQWPGNGATIPASESTARQDLGVAGTPVMEKLIQYTGSNTKATGWVPPRRPYRRTYVLLPQIEDTVECLEWRIAAAIGSSEHMWTIGHSADDAGVGPRDREIVAVNPEKWGDDLKAWHDEHYPNAEYETISTDSPWEMAIELLPVLNEDIALAQTDPRWADCDFGEHPDPSSNRETIGRYGSFLTGLAIILRKVYQRGVTPPALDKLLVAARAAYVSDNLMVWHSIVPLFPAFDESIKDNRRRSARELGKLLNDGWEIILREADGSRFVYLESVEGDMLHIIDSRDGKRKEERASAYRGIRAARARKRRLASGSTHRLHGNAETLDYVPPRTPYKRTYVLLPQIEGTTERIDWRVAAAIGSSRKMRTVGHSIDDAGIGPRDREIVAVNPEGWDTDLRAWYDEHYPDAEYKAIEAETPWEMAIKLLPVLDDDIALAQTDPRWAKYDFGEHPDPPTNRETIGRYGCFMTGLAIILRKLYQRDVTPPVLDKLLVAARAAYVSDNLMAWHGAVPLFPIFDDSIKDNRRRSARELENLLNDGWEIILMRADGAHFVYLESVEGDILHIIDTWDGKRKKRRASAYGGVRAARVRTRRVASGSTKRLHGEAALDYTQARRAYRCSYVLLPQIEDTVERIDWRIAAAIGSSEQTWTIGHSADEIGIAPRDRRIVAVNPEGWDTDLRAWYDEHYPNAEYKAIEAETPWEMAIKLLPVLDDDIALAQTDPRWAKYDFGEHPDPPTNRETIGRYGCFMTGLAIILRKLYQRDVTPPVLDKLLVAARAAYVSDNLMAWHGAVPLFPIFDDSIKDDRQRSAHELKGLLSDGWEIILRRADGAHFVYLESVEGGVLHIIDTWDGDRKVKAPSAYRGIRAARVKKMLSYVPVTEIPKHTYVLLPRINDTVERIEWRVAAAIGSSEQMWTIGHSADEAGAGLQDPRIIAVNPEEWDKDLKAWYDKNYPDAEYGTVETDSPWEMAMKLLPVLNEDITLAQTDPRWADCDFGEHPDAPASGETIGRYGGFLTGLAIMLRKVYQRDVMPPVLDKLLVAARAAYASDDLMVWYNAVPLFSAFNDNIKDNEPRSALELERLLRNGWEIILKEAERSHFVYLEDVRGDRLHIIETWDGKREEKAAAEYRGVRAAHIKPQGPPPPLPKTLVGLHDMMGGEWMAAQGIKGCCLVHRVVQRQPVQIDCTHLQNGGITVIGRLNWGYAGSTGTLPRPEDKDCFVDAIVQTILAAQGVDYFHIGNEPNNRSEWPGFRTYDEFALTADYVTEIYNEIWRRVAGRAKLGPPPLDPYFGPDSNNRDWWIYVLDHIAGADALFLHTKTQSNDSADVRSRARFKDKPLTWQYLHLKTIETTLTIVPDRFRSLPVFITELNPQFLNPHNGATGWHSDNAQWVHEALSYFREEWPVTGVMFYRYEPEGDQEPFGLQGKPAILNAIREEALS